jgi:hypothetical protein
MKKKSKKTESKKDPMAMLVFCPRCLGSSESSSWNSLIIDGLCGNCGNGDTIHLARWAIDSIRSQASWVGKRYYPIDEDYEMAAELKNLRALVTDFPGRMAERANDPENPRLWWVTQRMKGGKSVSTTVDADSREEALALVRLDLPYCPDFNEKE